MDKIEFNEKEEMLEIYLDRIIYAYDIEEIKRSITFETTDIVLGYGNVYRYVRFGNVFLNDGTLYDVIFQITNLEPIFVFETINKTL